MRWLRPKLRLLSGRPRRASCWVDINSLELLLCPYYYWAYILFSRTSHWRQPHMWHHLLLTEITQLGLNSVWLWGNWLHKRTCKSNEIIKCAARTWHSMSTVNKTARKIMLKAQIEPYHLQENLAFKENYSGMCLFILHHLCIGTWMYCFKANGLSFKYYTADLIWATVFLLQILIKQVPHSLHVYNKPKNLLLVALFS